MAPFLVLIGSLLLFRGLGAAGVEAFSSWAAATRWALAVMFLVTASAHFTSMKADLVRMVPKAVPYPEQVVFLTGICEVLGAIGLLVPSLQRAAGIALVLFLFAVFPANVHAARTDVTIRGKPATPLWLRLPMQLLFIGLTWWSTQTRP
jgi:uncharacterized membrane protein